MHRRTLENKTLAFGHAGKLYKNSFVMYDKDTNSEWVHVTGECAKGIYKGKKLEFLPSKVMRWGEWKKLHPDTLVMKGQGRDGFMGTFIGTTGRAALGFHLRLGIASKLYSFSILESHKVVHDTWKGIPLVIAFSSSAGAAAAWDARADGQTLRFELRQEIDAKMLLIDAQTGSVWDPMTGRCVEGRLNGKNLTPIVGTPILLSRWRNFYPDGEVFGEVKR
ncbi:MAG: DUF3179 domain-containing protein [Planctomycetes bacterium]|nr:DUF3179 domain-containing protein [Planctomycetota bacterium]